MKVDMKVILGCRPSRLIPNVFIGSLVFPLACSIDERPSPEEQYRRQGQMSPVSSPVPEKPKTAGPLTSNVTLQCLSQSAQTPRAEGKTSSLLKIKGKEGLVIVKTLISDPKSIVYLRSELEMFDSGLYTYQVTQESGAECWGSAELNRDGPNTDLVVSFP